MEHIDNFLKISDSDISQRLIDEHLHLIDGFIDLPVSDIFYLEKNKLMSLSVSCKNISFIDFDDMLFQIQRIRTLEHIIFYQIKDFKMRVATISLGYDIIGFNSRMRRREEKLNQILND